MLARESEYYLLINDFALCSGLPVMLIMTRWRSVMRGNNAVQLILLAILFYSLASIIIIYVHLIWFFAEEEKGWRKAEDVIVVNKGNIVWNKRYLRNALSSKIISSHEISLIGWWMEHSKWDVDIRCFNQKWAICSKGFSTSCKPDGVRAVYQYVSFAQDSQINGLELSVMATADQLEAQAVGAAFGALAFIKFFDGSTETMQLLFPANIEPLTPQSISFSSEEENKYIFSVTVMLMCYGYTGSVHFTDPVLLPRALIPYNRQAAIVKCPLKTLATKLPVHGISKQEVLVKPSLKSQNEHLSLITLVTQLSMDRLGVLERSLKHWEGAVSVVIYVQTRETIKEDAEWQRLYVQKKLKNLNLSSQSHVTLAFGHSSEKDYPINSLRNIAIRQAKTRFILLVDADFQPSPEFQQRFITSLKHFPHSQKLAFVAPAFQYIELPQKSDSVPQTKEELLQLLHREDPFILPFRMAESSDSHRMTDYWRWYRADKPYYVNTFSDKYEPYIILQRSSTLPMYDERFFGYGMNKVTHITELFAANYTFVVLPDIWVLHLPHKVSPYTLEFLQNPHQRLRNRIERFEFLADIMRKYKVGHCKQHR